MIFLTVGTQFPFDRLVTKVDSLVQILEVDQDIVAQIGNSTYVPRNFSRHYQSLEKSAFDQTIQKASAIVGHAGMGTILLALQYDKPLLVMPRLVRYGEVVNDHQVSIAQRFSELGHLISAEHEGELADKLRQLETFVPTPRENQADDVAHRIETFLDQLG